MTPRSPFPNLRREADKSKSMDWGKALPAVVRLLANNRADVALPAPPIVRLGENSEYTFSRALAYWNALEHILRFQLGWSHCAQGLARWLDEGRPTEFKSLALVRQVWLGDGHLERYLAWRIQKVEDQLPSAWARQVAGLTYEWGQEGQPIGPWQLHLEVPGGHALSPQLSHPPRLAWLELVGNATSHDDLVDALEPVLLFDGSLESGWYGALNNAPSTAVRVVSQAHGLVGRFTRSPTTQRWHTVSEDVHSWGVRSL